MQTFLSATRRDDESFPGIHEDDIPLLGELTDRNIQIHTIFLKDQSELFAELSRRSSMKRKMATSLLRFKNHICWTADISKLLKKFGCYICNQFFKQELSLFSHLIEFDFESITVLNNTLRNTDLTSWIEN